MRSLRVHSSARRAQSQRDFNRNAEDHVLRSPECRKQFRHPGERPVRRLIVWNPLHEED